MLSVNFAKNERQHCTDKEPIHLRQPDAAIIAITVAAIITTTVAAIIATTIAAVTTTTMTDSMRRVIFAKVIPS